MEASGSTKCCIYQLTRNSLKDNQFIFPCQLPCLLLCVVYRSHNYNEVHRNQKNSTQVGTTVLKRNTYQYRYLYIRRKSNAEESAIKDDVSNCNTDGDFFFNILFTVHLGIILVNNQFDALFQCIYFTSLHVSSNPVLIIRRINCINTSSGMYHSV
jgi:hypothetical protein